MKIIDKNFFDEIAYVEQKYGIPLDSPVEYAYSENVYNQLTKESDIDKNLKFGVIVQDLFLDEYIYFSKEDMVEIYNGKSTKTKKYFEFLLNEINERIVSNDINLRVDVMEANSLLE